MKIEFTTLERDIIRAGMQEALLQAKSAPSDDVTVLLIPVFASILKKVADEN